MHEDLYYRLALHKIPPFGRTPTLKYPGILLGIKNLLSINTPLNSGNLSLILVKITLYPLHIIPGI